MNGRTPGFVLAVCLLAGLLTSSCASAGPETAEPTSPMPSETATDASPSSVASPSASPKATDVPQSTTTHPVTTTTPASIPSPAPSPTPTPTTTRAVSDDGWGPWGPVKWPDEFRATSGARLDFVKEEDTIVGGSPAIVYFLMAAGLPADSVYHLWIRSLSAPTPTELVAEARLDDSGYVTVGGGRFRLTVGAPARGEEMEFALMTADKAAGVIGKVVPYPIESRQGPYRLWVEILSKNGDVFGILGEGFEPNEETSVISTSDSERADGKVTADDKGRLAAMVLPGVPGKESGLATFTVIAKRGVIFVSYQWGVEAIKTPPLSPGPTPTPSQEHGAPTIDGTITPGEWNTTLAISFSMSLDGANVPGTIYVSHDGTKVYMAVTFAWSTITPGDSLTVHFDNDGAGGPRVAGDDVVQVSDMFSDWYVDLVGATPEVGARIQPDGLVGGTNDGYGVRSTDATSTTYELWHPLDSTDDSRDFSLHVGDTFGFTAQLRIGPAVRSIPTGWLIKTDEYIGLAIRASFLERIQ